MLKDWNMEFNQFLLLVVFGLLGGWAVGYPGWGLGLVSMFYCLWMLMRTRDLAKWLSKKEDSDPPESSGIWGTIFDELYRQKKLSRRTIANLHAIIIRAQQSTNAINDAVVVVDKNGNLEWWNESGNRLLGLRIKTDRGQPITNLLRDPRFIHYFERNQYEQALEIPSVVHNNTVLQFEINVFGEGERLMVVRDISRLHHLEQMRKDFVANVSHELRTPLTVIKGYLETFIDSSNNSSPPLFQRGLQQMQQQTKRMELLINDLLMLARLESDNTRRPLKPVTVSKLLHQIHSDAFAFNDEKQHDIHLEIDSSVEIYGDEKELRSAFSNLVMNAIKYTPEFGQIHIRWKVDEDGAYMEVEDDGYGIEKKHIPRLTERFYRADQSRNAKTGGTGLGLAIVKHVLLHHNAKLEIASELGEGSVFTCHFPPQCIVKKHQQSVA